MRNDVNNRFRKEGVLGRKSVKTPWKALAYIVGVHTEIAVCFFLALWGGGKLNTIYRVGWDWQVVGFVVAFVTAVFLYYRLIRRLL